MNYKHRQVVTCEIKGVKIDDAKISIDDNGYIDICQNKMSGEDTDNKLGYRYSWYIGKGTDQDLKKFNVTNLRPVEKTLRDIEVGDIIVNKNKREARVLAVLGDVFLQSKWGYFDGIGGWYTFAVAEKYGWKLKEEPTKIRKDNRNIYSGFGLHCFWKELSGWNLPEKPKKIREVTIKEVCEKFGEEVKIKVEE